MKEVRLGFIGMGTVGVGVVNVLKRNQQRIEERTGIHFKVDMVCVRDLNRDRHIDTDDITFTSDPFDVTTNKNIDIIVELMGGVEFAKKVSLSALEHGKHIVSANKALFAEEGNEVLKYASERQLLVAFEGAVAGGIPILEVIREGMVGNEISSIAGIINGTSNYILTQMEQQGRSFDDALKKAQELGYAEADPTLDINGGDAAHKLSILASIAFGMPLVGDELFKEGIESISSTDVAIAGELGYAIKLLGIAAKRDNGIELRVHPTLVPMSSPLARINGVTNAVQVTGDAVGPIMTTGAGAGGEATASAVIADLVKVSRSLNANFEDTIPPLGALPEKIKDQTLVEPTDFYCGHYLRVTVDNVTGVMAAITQLLADENVSISSILQKEKDAASDDNDTNTMPIVLLTEDCKEKQINSVVNKIEELESTHGKVVHIRAEHF